MRAALPDVVARNPATVRTTGHDAVTAASAWPGESHRRGKVPPTLAVRRGLPWSASACRPLALSALTMHCVTVGLLDRDTVKTFQECLRTRARGDCAVAAAPLRVSRGEEDLEGFALVHGAVAVRCLFRMRVRSKTRSGLTVPCRTASGFGNGATEVGEDDGLRLGPSAASGFQAVEVALQLGRGEFGVEDVDVLGDPMALMPPLPAEPNPVARPQQWPLPPTAPLTMTWPRPECRAPPRPAPARPARPPAAARTLRAHPTAAKPAERWRRNSRCQRP